MLILCEPLTLSNFGQRKKKKEKRERERKERNKKKKKEEDRHLIHDPREGGSVHVQGENTARILSTEFNNLKVANHRAFLTLNVFCFET